MTVALLDRHFAEFDAPFEWGRRDCVTFIAQWVLLSANRRLIPAGLSWNDEASADSAMLAMGCLDVRALAGRFLEPCERTAAMAGDVVSRRMMPCRGWTLGICAGAGARFLSLNSGLIEFPMSRCGSAWRIR